MSAAQQGGTLNCGPFTIAYAAACVRSSAQLQTAFEEGSSAGLETNEVESLVW